MNLEMSFKAALSMAFIVVATACAPGGSDTALNTTAEDNSGIIGGTAVPAGSAVHQSTVLIWDTVGGSICSGSILANNIILTAAHCIGAAPRNHLILFTTSMDVFDSIKSNPAALKAMRQKIARPVSKTALHPMWLQPVKNSNPQQITPTADLALMQFEGPMPAGFRPATFVPTPKSAATDFVKQGTLAVVAGYGVSKNDLIEVKPSNDPKFAEKVKSGEYFCEEDETTAVKKCFREDSQDSGTLNTTDLKMYQRANRSEVILQQNEGKAACMGDSGGPAYVKNNGKLYLWGVASRVSRGCNGFAIYTDVTSEFAWMKQTISAMLSAPETLPLPPGQAGPPSPVKQPHPTQPAKPKMAI